MANHRNVGSKARNPFIHIFKRLQIGQVHHHKKSLLVGILDFIRDPQNLLEFFLNQLRDGQRVENRPAYANRPRADASA